MAATSVIRGNLLESFDEEPQGKRAAVIVEAKRPPVPGGKVVRAGVRTSPRELLPAPAKKAPAPAAKAQHTPGAADNMRAVEAALKELGVFGRARRNELSGSFVVELTREELERLSRSPAVQAIRADTLRKKL